MKIALTLCLSASLFLVACDDAADTPAPTTAAVTVEGGVNSGIGSPDQSPATDAEPTPGSPLANVPKQSVPPIQPDAPQEKPKAASTVPPEMVGSWMYGSISPTTFWDDTTGRYLGNARNMASLFTFNADGTYHQYVFITMRTYSYVSDTRTYAEGTVTFDGDTFTVHPTKGRYKSNSHRIDRDMTAEDLERHTTTTKFRIFKNDKGEMQWEAIYGEGATAQYKRFEE